MANFGDYPPNMVPQDALIVREQEGTSHEVVQYSGEDLARSALGPANPFKSNTSLLGKRKNVLTGAAEKVFVSEHTFRNAHREHERVGDASLTGAQLKARAKDLRSQREAKGNTTVVEGDGSYVGPWAKYRRVEYEDIEADDDRELASDEEYEEVTDDDDVVASGTVVQAPVASLARREEVEKSGAETSIFNGAEEYDYQGRSRIMHIPQDLDINLRAEPGSRTNYIPRKLIHTWKHHSQAVTALRLFPKSSHVGLSGSADSTVKIFDIYHDRELLRTYQGHTKAITDLAFNHDGTQFVSAGFDRKLRLWQTETGQCVSSGFETKGKTPHVVRYSTSSENAHEFLAGMSDNRIVQYDTRAGNDPVQEYDHHLKAISTIEFVDEGRRFMSTSADLSIRTWEYGINVPIKTVAEPSQQHMSRATIHPSGKWICYQCADNQVLVFSTGDKYRQNRKKSFRGHVTAGLGVDLSFSPDGQFLASGDQGGYLVFWDWKTQKMYEKIKASDQAVTSVVWHTQETSKVLTAGAEGVIKYWD